MNIVKISLLILALGLSLAARSVNAGPVVNGAVKAGQVVAKHVGTFADVYKAMWNARKASSVAVSSSLLASNHSFLANHPYATAAGYTVGVSALACSVMAIYYTIKDKVAMKRYRGVNCEYR